MTENSTEKLVLPGEVLGTAEEFVPGHGTYEDGGRIYAALLGHSRVDPRDRAIRVEAINAIPELHEGDLVYARVEEVKSAMAVCTILALESSRRTVPGNPEGTVHISKAKEGYTESLGDAFQPGDIVLARILQTGSSFKLSTASPELGVVSARCQVCHGLVIPEGQKLVCPRCGHEEHRKLAGADVTGEARPPARTHGRHRR